VNEDGAPEAVLSMQNPTVLFTRPGNAVFEDRPVPAPGPGQLLLRTRRTLISTGTELTVLSGDFPDESAWADYGEFPFVAGYSSSAEVVDAGEGVEDVPVGSLVAAPTPHARYAVAPVSSVARVGRSDVAVEDVTFTTLAQTAMNGVRRARVAWGDSVVVFGLGLLGQLAVRFCRLSGARPVIGVDVVDSRLSVLPRSAATIGINPDRDDLRQVIGAATRRRMADVVIEATGDPNLIPAEFDVLRAEQGRFVLLSSPRGDATAFNFHDLCNRPSHTIIGTHISSHPAVETPDALWTLGRNAELFFDLVGDGELEVASLVTHRLAFVQACDAYRMLLADRSQALAVVLDWDR
jgi:2-desacetyl-2-hydroxyethyl bacteriochlorophyllide A dehydrogenase